MGLQIDIVCENTVGRPIPARGEHGFACLVSTSHACWLFDTGRGETVLANLAELGLAADRIKGVILSHGHNDHCGGLLPLLRGVGPRPVFAHPQVFAERFWQGEHERRDIGMPYSRSALESAGAEFIFLDSFTELEEGLYFSGGIPRRSLHEAGDPHLIRRSGDGRSWIDDDFPDDVALGIATPKGLVVLLGCAHAGLINTLEHFRQRLDNPRIHAIVGGTHLGPASDKQFAATLNYLEHLEFDRLGVSHCTGQIRSAQLFSRFPNKVFFANVGTSMKIV